MGKDKKNKEQNNTDKINAVKSRFQEQNRYPNFGDILLSIHAQGFRCHSNTHIEIKNPITAFCGLNGAGKSTLLQLAAVAYMSQRPQERYYISSFIKPHRFDPNPYRNDARVKYEYWKPERDTQTLTISKDSDGGWNGYQRRPKRKVLYLGVGSYLPKVDKSDFITRYPQEIELLRSTPVSPEIGNWVDKILGRSYQDITSHEFKFRKKTDQINSVQYGGVTYSEPHMGYGEARSQYLIRLIEALPEKSLILLEEPEISLHPSAQYHFGCYLVDICWRKNHQIILTTHSESLLSALPSQSRIYLDRTQDGVKPIDGLTPSQAHSLMSEKYVKSLYVLVEDKSKPTAKAVLQELIRCVEPRLLDTIKISLAGDCNSVKGAVRALADTGLPVAGVLDADQNPSPKENIFTLPGSMPPEQELFKNSAVKTYLSSEYKLDLDDYLASKLTGVDHHYWFEKLAEYLNISEEAILTEVARVYAQSLSSFDFTVNSLIEQLQQASS